MSSTYSYTVSPASLHGRTDNRDHEPHYTDTTYTQPNHAGALNSQQLLSPYSSHIRSNSASPINNSYTPAESTSSLSVLPSDFSSEFGDPFFGVNFNDPDGGTPSFLDEGPSLNYDTQSSWNQASSGGHPYGQSDPPSPKEPASVESNISAPHLTPETNAESWSSADSPAPATLAMTSPRVTVSVWGKEGEHPVHTLERSFTPGTQSSRNVRMGNEDALSIETLHGSLPSVSRDTQGSWVPNSATGQRGLAPDSRSSAETKSPNQLATARVVDAKNQQVASWVSNTLDQTGYFPPSAPTTNLASHHPAEDDNIPTQEIPLGHTTVNRHVPDQVYYNADFGEDRNAEGPVNGFDQTDYDLLPMRNWGDAPMMHPISQIDSRRNQPETSQAAIQKFERMCQDNASVVSHAATWGTRRRSMPSIIDTEGVISGGFFKKLTLKGDSSSRRPSLLKEISSLVRRPSHSQLLKRRGTSGEDSVSEEPTSSNRRESRDSLAPPSRTPSWGMRQKQMPSLNTAIVGMATGAASIGASHARTGSISASSMASPKSPFGLAPVKNTLRRPRSKTEIPKSESSHPNIVSMLKKAGGPPIAQLANPQSLLEPEDDDDEDDEGYDEADMKIDTSRAEDINPNFEGFQQHILRLNPALSHTNQYLVERIAHQMVVRYKNLQNQKIKHLKAARSGHCSSGAFCKETGGVAVPLDSKHDVRGIDPLSTRPESSDGDTAPHEGAINTETFPAGIPLPSTAVLPAEFECQICFAARKFIKPSDWTKHVHEDVQPFTCTWDRCRDPKTFKRKADWVRHENEGHRHLEWWTCDVEDCKHTCYRRDNFLQHLVREHKFTEPKVKTKAAIKKAGGTDPTWQKVEKCHVETSVRPQEEACRFCGKTFPTWKKLTVHLAKHMEHISLPVLRLVSAKDLNEDTIISPVQDPPPRNFLPTPVKTEAPTFSPQRPHAFSNPIDYSHSPHNAFGFQSVTPAQMQQFYNPQANSQYDSMSQNPSGGLMMPQFATGSGPQYQPMPVSAGVSYGNAYMPMQNNLEPFPAFSNPLGLQDPSGSQMSYDTMTNPTMPNVDHYSSHGSVSPYQRSPHPGNSSFYPQ
ncbi:hypothetical protein SCAR479_12154 [Seiridium cardinale]|uniref:C2H2-type domain-containing protein n=1 Tax=Seiridium cardinale TaxID=138064 RepID=A0ABR2XBW7_9PEZI